MKKALCFLFALAALAASATTNNVEYIRIPVVRIPTTVVDAVELPEVQVKELDLAEKSARLTRMIKQWETVYETASGETIHPRSHFGRKKAAILKTARKEGVTDEVLQSLTDYQIQLNQYLKRQALQSRKESAK